jgi:hypothetical protein
MPKTESKEVVREVLEQEEDVPENIELDVIDKKETESENTTNLSNVEYEFMKCLLYGKEYNDLIKSQGLMLSVLIDSVNQNLFDMFGDTVIIYEGDKPELFEDYGDELKVIIRE